MSELSILYSFRRCPYAMRARMAIAVSGIEVDLREIVLRDKPAEMLTASPKGTVPVLVLANGDVIDESLNIMHWALTQNDPEVWLAHTDTDLIAINDGPFKAALDRYKYPHRFGLSDGLAYRQNGAKFLIELETRLCRARFLSGDTRRFADIAIFPFVRQFAATDRAWFDAQDWQALCEWLSALTSDDLFQKIMRKQPIWMANVCGSDFTAE